MLFIFWKDPENQIENQFSFYFPKKWSTEIAKLLTLQVKEYTKRCLKFKKLIIIERICE